MPAALGRLGLAAVALSVALFVLVGSLGPSATEPFLGTGSGPPWTALDRPGDADPGVVTLLLMVALLTGTLGLSCAYAAVTRGWRPSPRRLLAGSAVAVAVLLVVPPMGSADPLSYAAYGRITVTGGNPYVTAPDAYRGGTDPVTSAVQDPWRSTPSVYGPVATAVQAGASAAGGTSVRLTVWLLSLLCGGAFLLTGGLLWRLAPDDPRPLVLWSLNPLLLWALVAGAHVDALLVPAVAGAFLAARRFPLLAGALIGVAAAVKVPALLVLVALLWTLRRDPRRAALGVLGALVVLAVGYAVTGPRALGQLGRASRLVSLASPWNPVSQWLHGPLSFGTSRHIISVLSLLVAAVLVIALHRLLPTVVGVQQELVRTTAILATAYLVAAPYALPWYDALIWVGLAVSAGPRVIPLVIARSAVLASAYVPGRVHGVPAGLDKELLQWRGDVVPWLAWGLVLTLVLCAAPRRAPAP